MQIKHGIFVAYTETWKPIRKPICQLDSYLAIWGRNAAKHQQTRWSNVDSILTHRRLHLPNITYNYTSVQRAVFAGQAFRWPTRRGTWQMGFSVIIETLSVIAL